MLESRDEYKAERELVEQNTKLTEEINKLRKREHQLKAQLSNESSKATPPQPRRSKFDTGGIAKLMMNLASKKNDIMKDLDEKSTQNGGGSSAMDRKCANKNYVAEDDEGREQADVRRKHGAGSPGP